MHPGQCHLGINPNQVGAGHMCPTKQGSDHDGGLDDIVFADVL